jgi:hypothetical protein
MSASNTFENGLWDLVFLNTNLANIGDTTGLRGSSTAGNLYIALYTADPGETGTATTNETAYTSYARVAVARTSGGFTRTNNSIANTAVVTFPQCGVTGATITHFGIVTSASGAGDLLISGALTSPSSLAVSNGIVPEFAAGALTATID